MKPLVLVGVVLALVGLVLLAYPAFTTHQTKDVADVGPLHLQTNEEKTHFIPPILSGGILAIGVLLAAGGMVSRRN